MTLATRALRFVAFRFVAFRFVALLAAIIAAMIGAAANAAEPRIDPLPPDEAFRFSAVNRGEWVDIRFRLADDIYLYKHRLAVTVAADDFRVAAVDYPAGVLQQDEFFGEQEVFYGDVNLRATIDGDGEFVLKVFSQGCDALLKICYPPRTDTVFLNTRASTAENPAAQSNARQLLFSSPGASADEAGAAAGIIAEGRLWWTAAFFFGFGLLLAFTPCVLPMLPILLGVIGGAASRRLILFRTGAYIVGVTTMFTLLGVAAGISGRFWVAALQQPPALVVMAAIFIALALSLFGVFELRLPMRLRSGGEKPGGIGGALALGMVSAVTVSPCVAAPMLGALLYIGKSGDAAGGALSLFSLSLGMCAPLLVAGIGAGHVLPKAGEWTNNIKRLFGVLLLGAAVWVSSPLLPILAQMIAYGVLLFAAAAIIHDFAPARNAAVKTAAAVALFWGAAFLLGAASGGRDVLLPLSHWSPPQQSRLSADFAPAPRFHAVNSVGELQTILNNNRAPIMLEFYADWCVSCKEFERFTLSDARVRRKLQKMLLLRADVTEDSAAQRRLLGEFDLYGPPAIIFFRDGRRVDNVQVAGHQSAEKFLAVLAAVGVE